MWFFSGLLLVLLAEYGRACAPGLLGGQSPPIQVTIQELPTTWAKSNNQSAQTNVYNIQNDLKTAVQNAANRAFPYGGLQMNAAQLVSTVTLDQPSTFACASVAPDGSTSNGCATDLSNPSLITKNCPVSFTSGCVAPPWRFSFYLTQAPIPVSQQQLNLFASYLQQEIQSTKQINQVTVDPGTINQWIGLGNPLFG